MGRRWGGVQGGCEGRAHPGCEGEVRVLELRGYPRLRELAAPLAQDVRHALVDGLPRAPGPPAAFAAALLLRRRRPGPSPSRARRHERVERALRELRLLEPAAGEGERLLLLLSLSEEAFGGGDAPAAAVEGRGGGAARLRAEGALGLAGRRRAGGFRGAGRGV